MADLQARILSGGEDWSVEPDAVRRQLCRILHDPHFQGTSRRREMLRFIVEETLAGRTDGLKGYGIATRVFGRSEDFDPQADPVVRIEARRLRRDLEVYYGGAGRSDPVVISIPKGRYLPVFERREGAEPEETGFAARPPDGGTPDAAAQEAAPIAPPPAPRRWPVLAILALLLSAALGLGLTSLRQPANLAESALRRPSILVMPFRALGDSAIARDLSEGVAQELVGNLMRFPDFRLFMASPLAGSAAGADRERLMGERVPYVVTGEIAAHDAEIRLSAQLADAASGRVIWSETYARDLTAANLLALQADLAGEIAAALGQPYGVVRNDIFAREIPHVPTELESYHCVLRAYQYRRSFAEPERAGVRACLEAAVRRDPGYPEAWAMLGWLHLDEGRYAAADPVEAEAAYERGFAAASKALALDPDNASALKALSSINHYRGDFEEGWRLAREALRRNPHDPDTLAQLGWRLAVRGRFDEGIPLLHRAIERSIRPPGWYYHLIAVDHLMKGEHAEMLATAQLAAAHGGVVAQSFVAVAEAHLGRPRAARAALLQAAEASPRFAADPAAYYRTHQATEAIVAELMRGLRLAGWRPPATEPGE